MQIIWCVCMNEKSEILRDRKLNEAAVYIESGFLVRQDCTSDIKGMLFELNE